MKQRLGECEECIFIQLSDLPSDIYIKSSGLGSYICRVSHSCSSSSTAAEKSDPPYSPPPRPPALQPSLKAKIWLARTSLSYIVSEVFIWMSSSVFTSLALHMWTGRLRSSWVEALSQSSCRLVRHSRLSHRPRLHLQHTIRPDLFSPRLCIS